MQATNPTLFVDQNAIAAMLSLDKRTLRRLIIRGKFPPADLHISATCLRWRKATVETWLEQHAQGAGGAR